MIKKRVYVSSTYMDLVEHRAVVKAALERAQFDVECMEKYPAFDERPQDKCLEDVAQCDYYVLILALRYGFQPPKDNPKKLSITQLEYEEAVHKGKPRLVFLLDEEHPWPPKLADPNWQSPKSKIAAFRKRVGLDRGIRTFTTPYSLATAVLEALRTLEQKAGSGTATASSAAIREAYLAWLRRTCESVELLGLDLKETQNVRLGQVYVPAVTAPKVDKKRDERKAELGHERQHDLLLHRLGEESLYVPGAPGAGKSPSAVGWRWRSPVVPCHHTPWKRRKDSRNNSRKSCAFAFPCSADCASGPVTARAWRATVTGPAPNLKNPWPAGLRQPNPAD